MVDCVSRKIGVIGVGESAVGKERLGHGRGNGQVAVENEPGLELWMPTPECEGELVNVATDAALCRPRVLECLDVEEKPDRRAQRPDLVAVTIATVSAFGFRPSMGWSIVVQCVASRRWTSVLSTRSQPSRSSSRPARS